MKCDGIIANCDSLVYYKVRWTVATNGDSFFITKCDTVYYKLRQVLQSAMNLLQIATGVTKCDEFITNCDRYYKVRWLLQIAAVRNFNQNLNFLALFCISLKRLERIFLKSLHIIFIMYIITSKTFVKIDSQQHLDISRQTYPTNRSKICVTTFTVLAFC